MWNRFAKLAVEREYEVEARDYFTKFANLSWSMTKVNYSGQDFWRFMERLYLTEIERTKLKEQPREMTASVLSTICLSLKDCQPHNLTDDFWQ